MWWFSGLSFSESTLFSFSLTETENLNSKIISSDVLLLKFIYQLFYLINLELKYVTDQRWIPETNTVVAASVCVESDVRCRKQASRSDTVYIHTV